ncbi:hypothetical protein CAPN002_19660 [Capnocytophaga stomatis]|nr:hypothetical protein CAPN002_19660 [Capnocytophaga stomatis]
MIEKYSLQVDFSTTYIVVRANPSMNRFKNSENESYKFLESHKSEVHLDKAIKIYSPQKAK